MRTVHFIGIGGVGMNGLAQLAVLSGYRVTGSDRAYQSDARPFNLLEDLGISFFSQDGSGISDTTDCVVYSSAIEGDNPDLAKAESLGLLRLHRAEFLKQLVGNGQLVAVAGTAGKTTTTGLLGWIYECLGKDPSVYNGAAVLNWKSESSLGNIRRGSPNLWIIEADESDRSFLHFHPTHTLITNISKDHYELDELHRMFDQFRQQTSGLIVDGASLPLYESGGSSFVLQGITFTVPIMGRHNLENAFNAVRLCAELGFDLEAVRDAIASFKGIERRLEVVGCVNGITVVDDYAHNPAKISAALATVSEQARRVHAFWRPHGFAPLYQCRNELAEVFAGQISLFILPVYYAGGSVDRKITAESFVQQLHSAGIPALFVEDYATLEAKLKQAAAPGDIILGMGARDPELPIFAKRLLNQWTTS